LAAEAALCFSMTLQNSENSISPLLSSSTCRGGQVREDIGVGLTGGGMGHCRG
jgi:hypothetical protein